MKNLYKCIFIACLGLTSCGGGERDPLAGTDLYGAGLPATLTAYEGLKTGRDQTQNQGVPGMYVDFSAGMYTAFATPLISSLMTQCFNAVLSRQLAVYKLSEGRVDPLPVSNSTELGQIVGDANRYRDVRAPIQAAVEKIVDAKSDALLITDFEEWQNNTEVTATAYLKIPFSKWLKMGNSISFFIADYQEGKVSKHIYFTVFTRGRPTETSLITKLRPRLTVLPARFDLATDAYVLTTDYPGTKTGGLFHDLKGKNEKEQNVLDLQAGYFKGRGAQQAFEYYPLGLNWETIDQARKDYQDNNQLHDLFRGLFVDLANTDSYLYGGLEVKTYDVTTDFESYARSAEARRHKPALAKGADGQIVISDKERDPVALGCYANDGSLRPEYTYHPAGSDVLTDLFMLNSALFTNTFRADPKKVEVGITFSQQFGLAGIPNPKGLIRIVVSLRDVAVNTANPVLGHFKWVNRNGVPNVGLYESVKTTLDELKPADKPIYTYYIKTTE